MNKTRCEERWDILTSEFERGFIQIEGVATIADLLQYLDDLIEENEGVGCND